MSSSTMSIDKQRLAVLDKQIRGGFREIGKNGTFEELVQFYNTNGKDYNEREQISNPSGGGTRQYLASSMAALVPDKDAKILDVAAGSGLLGKELRKLGFNNIDAIEPAEQFLDLAKSENVYKKYIVDSINADKQCSIEDDAYDVLIMSGAFMEGHLKLNCLPELMRITKKGGLMVFNIYHHYQNIDPEYAEQKFELEFQSFVDNGLWVKWDADRDAPYRECPRETCNIYRVIVA